ncbi:VWA domain-containing protein [Parafrigoribacterium mesophilum]|uniref:vWA domain-containing protein n=1 Tax=Parafrigoribacterium mesophilum TaxID=433646 RepID=UPI0031FBD89A
MPTPLAPTDAPLESTGTFVGFAQALRSAGLPVGPDRTQVFLDAAVRLGVGDRRHVYWAGRATLCTSPEDIVTFDKTFERWFSAEPAGVAAPRSAPQSVAQADITGDGAADQLGEEHRIAVLASEEEALRHRDVASLSAVDRTRLARLFAGLSVTVPQRRSLRRHPHRRGDIDAARTVREQLRRAGEPGPLRHRRARPRARRIVFLVDVSGSMQAYADSLLRLAHRVVMAAPYSTEVFTLGTRLTRVTTALRLRDPEQALQVAGAAVPDWSGGTRLGEVLRAFADRWGQRSVVRGAVIVIASDGWERGDPTLLGSQVCRLQRLGRVVLWSNPHLGKAGYAPIQGGIVAALPYLDALVAGHSLAAFEELLQRIADA